MWARFDDRFPNHPKILSLTDSEFRLHVSAICYCCDQLTDGLIAKCVPSSLPRAPRAGRLLNAIASLERAGLWEQVEGGWMVHDFLDWNPSSERVKAKKAARAAAGRRGGLAKANRPAGKTASNCQSNATSMLRTCSKQKRTPSPSPSPDLSSPTETRRVDTRPDVGQVFDHWKAEHGHPRAKLDRKRRARIEARLRDFSAQQLCWAITNARNDPFLMGEDPRSTRRYDGLETLLRDTAQVERLLELRERPRPVAALRSGRAADDWAAQVAHARQLEAKEKLLT